MKELKTVENDFKEAVRIIHDAFGEGYSFKNPELVRFLMEKIQQEKDRRIARLINNIADDR